MKPNTHSAEIRIRDGELVAAPEPDRTGPLPPDLYLWRNGDGSEYVLPISEAVQRKREGAVLTLVRAVRNGHRQGRLL